AVRALPITAPAAKPANGAPQPQPPPCQWCPQRCADAGEAASSKVPARARAMVILERMVSLQKWVGGAAPPPRLCTGNRKVFSLFPPRDSKGHSVFQATFGALTRAGLAVQS